MTLLLSLTLSLVHAAGPIVYTQVAEQNRLAAEAAARAKQQRQRDQQGMQQMMNALQGMGGGGGGGPGANARGGRGGQTRGGSAPGELATGANSGTIDNLEPCGELPPKVKQDLQEMMDFRKACPAANTGAQQKFAINSYRATLGSPRMYLFDENGQCRYQTSVAYGSGQVRGNTSSPRACAENNGKYTPAGMHLTVPHDGVRDYNRSNSLGLAGLEEQGSKGRGILIHGSRSPGMGYTHGCSGVSHDCLPDVMKFLGYGALVFNSFDDDQAADGCRNTAGMKRSGACRAEVAVNAAPATPGGSGGAAR